MRFCSDTDWFDACQKEQKIGYYDSCARRPGGRAFTPWGQGSLNIPFLIEGLKQAGYDGPLSIEYLADHAEKTLMEDMLRFVDELKKLVGQ